MADLREQILNSDDIKKENVKVDEWGVEVEVRGMTGAARNRLINKNMGKNGEMDLNGMYPDLIVSSVYDPKSGEQVFSEKDKDTLNAKSSGALEKVAQVAMRLSGLDEESHDVKIKN